MVKDKVTMFVIAIFALLLKFCKSQSFYVTTFVTATGPRGIKLDRTAQNVFVGSGDTSGIVNKIPISTGVVSTFSTGYYFPLDVEFDLAGNVYVADNGNNRVVKVPAAGGTGTALSGFSLSGPLGVKFGPDGTLYIGDQVNNRIVTFSNTSVAGVLTFTPVTTISPQYITFDSMNNLYFGDGGFKIRMISPSGAMSLIAGSSSGYVDGPVSSAQFACLRGITYDSVYDALYVADCPCAAASANSIRRIKSGQVTTIAGSTGAGNVDGYGTAALFNYPYGIAADLSGNVYVADLNNNRIRKVNTCPQNSAYSVSAGLCLCTGGYQLLAYSCQQCLLGTYRSASSTSACLSCPLGQESNIGRTACTSCVQGVTFRASTIQSQCDPCPPNSVCSLTSFTCNSGFRTNSTSTGCIACPANQEASADRTTCYTCDSAMQFFNSSSKTCQNCPFGATCDGVNLTCNPGFISTAGGLGCVNCPSNQATNAGRTSCISCAVTEFISSQKICASCPAGATCNGVTFTCGAGYEINSSNSGCQLCADGYSKSSSGNSACTQCLTGTESSANRQSCNNCASGYYRSSLNNNKCIPCPTGATCSTTAISRCPNGYKINGNSDGCDQCPIGQDSTDGINCQNCVAGYFKPLLTYSMCIKCPDGASSCGTSSVTCQSGYYYDSNVQCKRNDTYFALLQTSAQTAATVSVTSFVTLTPASISVFFTSTIPVQTQYQTKTVTQNAQQYQTQTVTSISTINLASTITSANTITIVSTVSANGQSQSQVQSANSVTIDFIGTLPISPLIFGAATFGAGVFIMLLVSLVCCRKSRPKRRDDDFEGAGLTTTMNTTSQRTFTNNSTMR